MAIPGILSLWHRHIIHIVAYILGCRTHNAAVIQLILNIMGHPAHNAAAHKQRCVQIPWNPQHPICKAAVEIHIGRKALPLTSSMTSLAMRSNRI